MIPKLQAARLMVTAYVAAFWAEVREGFDRGLARGRSQGIRAFDARDMDRGQVSGGNLVGLAIGIAVAVIVTVGVAIPITNDVIASSNLTGITALIVGFIPVMLGLMVFVATAAPIMART